MKTFRQLVVKHFALNYSVKIFGKIFTAVRASRVIYPTFVLAGVLTAINPEWPDLTWYTFLAYILVAFVNFLGFVYFRIYPVKWHELDDKQKIQYGIAVNSGQLTKNPELYYVDWEEWLLLCKKYNQ